MLFTGFSPSYMTLVQFPNQGVNTDTALLTDLRVLLEFHSFPPVSSFRSRPLIAFGSLVSSWESYSIFPAVTAVLLFLGLGLSDGRRLFTGSAPGSVVSAGGDCMGGEADPPAVLLVLSLTAMRGASSQAGPTKRTTRKRMPSMQLWIKGWTRGGKREGRCNYCPSRFCIQTSKKGLFSLISALRPLGLVCGGSIWMNAGLLDRSLRAQRLQWRASELHSGFRNLAETRDIP